MPDATNNPLADDLKLVNYAQTIADELGGGNMNETWGAYMEIEKVAKRTKNGPMLDALRAQLADLAWEVRKLPIFHLINENLTESEKDQVVQITFSLLVSRVVMAKFAQMREQEEEEENKPQATK